jgi:uncharacterized protein (TIGR00255 family)
MASSMTGYGRAETENTPYKFTVEITTINNRFLEFQIRLPKSLSPLESAIKNLLSAKFGRGKVSVSVNWEQEQVNGDIVLDEAKADAYHKVFQLLRHRFQLEGELSVGDFTILPDLVKVEKQDDDIEKIWGILRPAVESAADAAVVMRNAEGQNLVADMTARIENIRKVTSEIEALSGQNVDAYRAKLKLRLGELLGGAEVDEQRVAVEVAIMADKSDITEECVRLRSHLEQFELSFNDAGQVGKRLNFILQELNRETNTIGDKSAFFEISRRVIGIKEEIERLREQVQNIV